MKSYNNYLFKSLILFNSIKYAVMSYTISLSKKKTNKIYKISQSTSRSNLKMLHLFIKCWGSALFQRKQFFVLWRKILNLTKNLQLADMLPKSQCYSQGQRILHFLLYATTGLDWREEVKSRNQLQLSWEYY